MINAETVEIMIRGTKYGSGGSFDRNLCGQRSINVICSKIKE